MPVAAFVVETTVGIPSYQTSHITCHLTACFVHQTVSISIEVEGVRGVPRFGREASCARILTVST